MSKLNEINEQRPRTWATTVRCDITTAATLLVFWQSRDEYPRSYAELLRLSLETFRDVITSNYPQLEITSSLQANQILTEAGFADPTAPGRKNRASLIKQLQFEDSLLDGYDIAGEVTKTNQRKTFSNQQLAQAQRRFQQMIESPDETLEAATARREQELQDACAQLLTPPEEVEDDESSDN